FAAAAAAPGVRLPGRVVALALEADARAELGAAAEALTLSERALAEWDDDFGDGYDTRSAFERLPNQGRFEPAPDTRVSKAGLQTKIADLRNAAAARGGAPLEQGRRLLEQDRPADAIPLLERAESRRQADPVRA